MTDDYHNGFIIVPIKTDLSILSSADVSAVHPWRDLYLPREEPPEETNQPPTTHLPPAFYTQSVRAPQLQYAAGVTAPRSKSKRGRGGLVNPPRVILEHEKVLVNEIIRLCDVEKFRAATALKVPRPQADQVDRVTARLSRLSTSSSKPCRPVIYRYVDVINASIALLESIHFELFMPDRPDLRFLGVPLAAIPSGTVEGDLFRVPDAVLLSTPSFGVLLGRTYPVLWEACGIARMEFDAHARKKMTNGLSYVMKPAANKPGMVIAINELSPWDLVIRQTLFPDEDCRSEHSLVRVTSCALGTAHLFAVEPPKPGPDPPKKEEKEEEEEDAGDKGKDKKDKKGKRKKREKGKKGKKGKKEDKEEDKKDEEAKEEEEEDEDEDEEDEEEVEVETDEEKEEKEEEVEVKEEENDEKKEEKAEVNGIVPFAAAFGRSNAGVKPNNEKNKVKQILKKEEGKEEKKKEPPFDPRSEYLKRVCHVFTSTQHFGRIASEVRAIDVSEVERIEDRLGPFTGYGKPGDLKLMDELFRLGSRYRQSARGRDEAIDEAGGEMRVDESVILKTLLDRSLLKIENCRPLLDCIYDGRAERKEIAPAAPQYFGGLQLNEAQSRALRAYADADGPRVFCILSPPGSGKTTVAAAMAAEVADHPLLVPVRNHRRRRRFGVDVEEEFLERYDKQLLLSVQNVAVDNMGVALKKLGFAGTSVYNMKSTMKLDPHAAAPFDFLDKADQETLNEWKDGMKNRVRRVIKNQKDMDAAERDGRSREPEYEEQELNYEDCLTIDRRNYEKTMPPPIIVLSTVEMVLQKFYTRGNLRDFINGVKRIIIDEASLLTEAALFCLIRRFPSARIVLIGDNHQLPPFMYEENILGHELAGRAALSVAMKTGRVPIVELNEVYRAPPSLVAPYNRLVYEERLVSKKAEGEYPLSEIGLIHPGLPQLLLIDVNGTQARNEKTMSLSNKNEVKALRRLLRKFPASWTEDIMIICLYKDQKHRLQDILGKNYSILTVDSAQGKEKGIVILMTTRTQIPAQGSFFDSIERCNVSVSRQQKALIILGKASFLTTTAPWSTVVNGDDFTRIKAEDI